MPLNAVAVTCINARYRYLGQAHPSADEVMVLVDAQPSRTRGGRENHHEADVIGSGLGPSGISGHRGQ